MKSIQNIDPDQIRSVTKASEAAYANSHALQRETDGTKRALLEAAFKEGAELAPEIIRVSEEIYAYARKKFGDEPFTIVFLDRDARPFFHCFSKLHPEVPKKLYPVTRGIVGELRAPTMEMKDEQYRNVPYDAAHYFKYLDRLSAHPDKRSFAGFFQSGVRALQKIINEKHGKPKTKNVLIYDTGRNGTLMEFAHWFLQREFPNDDFQIEKLFAVSANPGIDGLERYDRANPGQLAKFEWDFKHPVAIRLDEKTEKIVYEDVQKDEMAAWGREPEIEHTKNEGHSFMKGIAHTTKRIVDDLLDAA